MHVSPREAESSSKKQLAHKDLGSCTAHTSHSNPDNPPSPAPIPKKRCLRNFPLKWGCTTGVLWHICNLSTWTVETLR